MSLRIEFLRQLPHPAVASGAYLFRRGYYLRIYLGIGPDHHIVGIQDRQLRPVVLGGEIFHRSLYRLKGGRADLLHHPAKLRFRRLLTDLLIGLADITGDHESRKYNDHQGYNAYKRCDRFLIVAHNALLKN